MPSLAQFHPQVVHFAVALLILGSGLRFLSCFVMNRWRWISHSATLLLLLGAVSATVSVKSGDDAHGPVERIPGARELVIEHEEYGKSARNVFLVVALIELAALALRRKESTAKYARYAVYASCAGCAFGLVPLYEAAEHGGELVYSYGGGPGLRTGDPKDTERLLLAGLYNQSRVDRREKRFAQSQALVKEMVNRWPADTAIRFLWAESLLLDAKDNAAAIRALDSIGISDTDARNRARKATLKADAFIAMGNRDSARAVLTPVVAAFPANTRLKAKLDSLK
jgi:uncharacterized membrane protein